MSEKSLSSSNALYDLVNGFKTCLVSSSTLGGWDHYIECRYTFAFFTHVFLKWVVASHVLAHWACPFGSGKEGPRQLFDELKRSSSIGHVGMGDFRTGVAANNY